MIVDIRSGDELFASSYSPGTDKARTQFVVDAFKLMEMVDELLQNLNSIISFDNKQILKINSLVSEMYTLSEYAGLEFRPKKPELNFCTNIYEDEDDKFICSECGAFVSNTIIGESHIDNESYDPPTRVYGTSREHWFSHCPNCGKKIIDKDIFNDEE